MALGFSIVVRCEGCIACHVKDAMQAGATRGEVIETIGVAVMMGGGPSVVYGIEAREPSTSSWPRRRTPRTDCSIPGPLWTFGHSFR